MLLSNREREVTVVCLELNYFELAESFVIAA